MIALISLALVCALTVSMGLTWVVRNHAIDRGWVAAPSSARHVHTGGIPRLGGVAIYLSFVFVSAIAVLVSPLFGLDHQITLRLLGRVIGPATIVFLIGLYDDVRGASPAVKIACEVAAGVLLYFAGFRILELRIIFGAHPLTGVVSLLITVLWTLLISNAFNLIDGLDGLAAGSALFALTTVLVVSLVHSQLTASLLAVVLAGATLGFLRFNFNPATIFLGDCGSLFLGFMLSTLSLLGFQQKSSTLVAVAIPIVSFGFPLLETAISVARRFLKGQPLFGADREHIHHKLLARGFSQREVVGLLYALSALFGLLSLFLLSGSGAVIGLVLFVVGAVVWVGVQHLGYHEFFELGRLAQRTLEQKRVIVNNLAIRRASEELYSARDFQTICGILDRAFHANDFDGLIFAIEPVRGGLRQSFERRFDAPSTRYTGAETRSWKLTLDLRATPASESQGFVSFLRTTPGPLMVDVNLLTSEFAVALLQAASWARRGAETQVKAAAVAAAVSAQ
jgi:UDP-GlcNAc:undecaprenyl-phosphate GlcNAc-1-phosphate transferase